jgi:hypothetical protein
VTATDLQFLKMPNLAWQQADGFGKATEEVFCSVRCGHQTLRGWRPYCPAASVACRSCRSCRGRIDRCAHFLSLCFGVTAIATGPDMTEPHRTG